MIRPLLKSDMSQLLAIEQAAHVEPWNMDTFTTCFQSGYIGWAVEENDEVMGFVIISMHVQECHILNLCIAPKYQHQGFGRQLLDQVLIHAKQQGVAIAYLEVRRSNTRAIDLYRKKKFYLVGMRKDYYPGINGNEDALIFAKNLLEVK